MDTPDDPIGRSGELAHLTTLHFAIHLIETGAKRLILPRSFDVLGDADDFKRAGGVVVDLGPHWKEGAHGVSRLLAGVDHGARDPVVFEGARPGRRGLLSRGYSRNSASASRLGPATEGSPGGSAVGGAGTSLTADFSQALVDQRNSHGPLSYGAAKRLTRPTPDVAGCEQAWEVRLEGQGWT